MRSNPLHSVNFVAGTVLLIGDLRCGGAAGRAPIPHLRYRTFSRSREGQQGGAGRAEGVRPANLAGWRRSAGPTSRLRRGIPGGGVTANPLQADYDGRPVFLIDASVFPGSSGSPVVICNQGGFATRQGFAVGNW